MGLEDADSAEHGVPSSNLLITAVACPMPDRSTGAPNLHGAAPDPPAPRHAGVGDLRARRSLRAILLQLRSESGVPRGAGGSGSGAIGLLGEWRHPRRRVARASILHCHAVPAAVVVPSRPSASADSRVRGREPGGTGFSLRNQRRLATLQTESFAGKTWKNGFSKEAQELRSGKPGSGPGLPVEAERRSN